jgi:hypothetical protein
VKKRMRHFPEARVRFNGRVYEAVVAAWQRRCRCDLYHSALQVTTPEGLHAIEMAPELIGGSELPAPSTSPCPFVLLLVPDVRALVPSLSGVLENDVEPYRRRRSWYSQDPPHIGQRSGANLQLAP